MSSELIVNEVIEYLNHKNLPEKGVYLGYNHLAKLHVILSKGICFFIEESRILNLKSRIYLVR